MNEAIDEVRDGYIWRKQRCLTCDLEPKHFLGTRGGASHRENLGVECEIWRCGQCGLIFPNPVPIPVEGLGQHYDVDADEYFQGHDKDTRLSGAKGLIAQAEGLLKRKGKLLDVGVGRGEILIAATEAGWVCEGVEPSETFADYAQARTGARIWREPIEESLIPDEEFDVVMLAAVLEHLYDPYQVISKISRVLKPGGLLYLDVPNEAGLYFRIGNIYQRMRGRKWCVNLAPTFPPFHVVGFSPRSLRAMLGKKQLNPVVWNVYPGTSMVPGNGGISGLIESTASRLITNLSRFCEMGTYIETWARKSG